MKLLGNLRVRLTAETEDFRRGLSSAQKNLQTFEKDLGRFSARTMANVASIGALTYAFSKGIAVANEYDKATNQLAATAKLTGVQLGFLQSVAGQAEQKFNLSKVTANALTIELTKLATKAGDVGKASAGLEAFLDIGAARGLNASQTLKAVQQSILGIDEGTDKLFSKNPSVLYAEFAKSIGTTAGKLTDAQKAQAILNAAMQDGEKVRGEYSKWLTTAAGQQFLMSQSVDKMYASIGKALQPAIVAVTPLIITLAGWIEKSALGWQMLGARMKIIPPLFRMIGAAITFNGPAFEQAKKDYNSATIEADILIRSLQNLKNVAGTPVTLAPPAVNTAEVQGQGKKNAREYFDGLATEWEELRHSIAMRSISLGGTDTQRYQLEEQHAINLLNIEREKLVAHHMAKDLTDDEYKQAMKELDIREQISKARTKENIAVDKHLAKQRNLLSLATSVGDLIPGQNNAGSGIGSKAGSVVADKLKLTGFLADTIAPGVGSLVGGLVGSLLSKKDKKPEERTISQLEAIERAQKATVTAIQIQTDRLLKPESRFVNLPSNFSLPSYRHNSPVASHYDYRTFSIEIVAPSGNAPDIRKEVEQAMESLLYDGSRHRSRTASRF